MKEEEPPQIELFMYSLNQEFPVGKGHAAFLKKRSELRVDEKTGELFTLQEVESQVYSKNRIEDKGLASKKVPKQEYTSGGGSPPEDIAAVFGNERLASEKVPIPEFTPVSGPPRDESVAGTASPWTAQWAQNGWVAQWAQNTTYTNT
jgi:hypothetical protein